MAVLSRWGNSLGVRIPKPIADQVHLKEGSPISIEVSDYAIIIRAKRKRKYTLNELLEGITPGEYHPEIDTGEAVGNEIA